MIKIQKTNITCVNTFSCCWVVTKTAWSCSPWNWFFLWIVFLASLQRAKSFQNRKLSIKKLQVSMKRSILCTKLTCSPVTSENFSWATGKHIGQGTAEHVGQFTSKHVDQITGEHVGEDNGEHLGLTTDKHVGQVAG